MKFRITEAVNKYDGNPIFYVYERKPAAISGAKRWTYRHGGSRRNVAPTWACAESGGGAGGRGD